MLKFDAKNSEPGKAGNAQVHTDFFQQFVAVPSPLNPRQIDMHALPFSGISMRDYFAAKALATCQNSWFDGEPDSSRDVAEWCYRVADAMIEARKIHRSEKPNGFPPVLD